ncbi:MAG: AAA family ATPase [Xenococcaceae cyanobacterium]
MARIFPQASPQNTGSTRAEPDIYWRLKKQLSDAFVVIHSLPWLASVAKEIDGRFVPTGEIDFIVLHQELGILAVEVKGGIFGYDKTEFVYKRTGQRIDPVRQVRRGTHALSKLLHNIGAGSWRIGYCLIFPHSEIREKVPIALTDFSLQPPQPISLDIRDINTLGHQIQEIMGYWKKALNTWQIKEQQFEKLIDVLLPSADYTPCWQTRIHNDTITWLKLTPEQSKCLDRISQENRLVVTGFPGTGKTLLLIEHTRRLSKLGQKVLVITYNVLLAQRLKDELSDIDVEVCTFYEQCRRASEITGNQIPKFSKSHDIENKKKEWYSVTAPNILRQAIEEEKLQNYDSLVVDEGQVLQSDWLQTLTQWFNKKQIIVFCDSTQVFNFEQANYPEEISKIIEAKSPYTLTMNLRSPYSIFDRIMQVRSSEYQQTCPRPYEADTLVERVINDTRNELKTVVDQLFEEKISPQSIIIINATFGFNKKEKYRDIEVVSASKFRGLESPIVIVWADGNTDDVSLLCAYTRATSRCIVIYDAINMLEGRYQTFGNIILKSGNIEDIQQEAKLGLTSGILKEENLNLVPISNKTIDLFWYPEWGGWIIYPREDNQVAQLMWAYHLIVTTNYPVYTWNVYDRGNIIYYESVEKIDDSSGRGCNLNYCDNCELVTPFISTSINQLDECAICLYEENENVITSEQTKIQAEFDRILGLGSTASSKDKRKLSIFLMALGRWNTIAQEKKQSLNFDLPIASGTIGYTVAHLLIMADILLCSDGILKLNEVATKYRDKWCPDLVQRIDDKSWRSIVARGMNTCLQQKLIEKVSKGIYQIKQDDVLFE